MTQEHALSRETFKRTEGHLYHYRENLARLETLEQELADLSPEASVHAQRYDDPAQRSDGWTSDPVAARLEAYEGRKARLEGEIRHLRRLPPPVTRLINDLHAGWVLEGSKFFRFRRILERWYLSGAGLTWENIGARLDVSRKTAMRLRQELVEKAAYYLGLDVG